MNSEGKMISDYDIQAFVDNELDSNDRQRIQAVINTHSGVRKRYYELLRQKSLIMNWVKRKET